MFGKIIVWILISLVVAHLVLHYNPDSNKKDSWIIKRTKELLPMQERTYKCLDLYPKNISDKIKYLLKNSDEYTRVYVFLINGAFFVYTNNNIPKKINDLECAIFRKEYVVKKLYLIIDDESIVYKQIGHYEALKNKKV